jgi:hypothetical protein
MLTAEEELFIQTLFRYALANRAYRDKVQEYTDLRSQLDDAKDPAIVAKSEPTLLEALSLKRAAADEAAVWIALQEF